MSFSPGKGWRLNMPAASVCQGDDVRKIYNEYKKYGIPFTQPRGFPVLDIERRAPSVSSMQPLSDQVARQVQKQRTGRASRAKRLS